MPLIKRGAVALGKGALKTGVRIADDVISGHSIKKATKRRVTDAGRNLMRGLLAPGVRARKRIKRAPAKKGVTLAKRRRPRNGKPTYSTMAFVHRQSCEGVKSELDIFTVPPTQTSIIDSHVGEHQPMSSLDSGGPIEFFISGSGDDYLDLANTMLHVQAKVTRANGDDLDLADPVGPMNNWLHSLFNQVDVYLNGTLVTASTNTYAYRAYIETLLSYGPDAKDTQLTSQLWHKDTATRMDAVEIADGPAANEGFVTRRENILRSRMVDMIGRLHVDLFLQDQFLINGVDVKIRLVRSKPAFALMAGGPNPDYKINIVNATLFAKKATLNPTVQMAHIKAPEKSTVKYPMRSVEYKVYSIPAGTRSHTYENLFLGTLPKRLVLCCIDNDAYNGVYTKNPLHAKNNAINFHAV